MSLAAGMDARGYGRAGSLSAAQRRTTGALMLTGLVGICVGTYALLDQTAPRWLVAARAGRRRRPRGRRLLVGRAPGAAHPLPPRPLAGGRDRRGRRAGSPSPSALLGAAARRPAAAPGARRRSRRVTATALRGRCSGAARGRSSRRRPVLVAAPPADRGRWPMLELRDVTFSYAADGAARCLDRRRPDPRGGRAGRSSPAAPASASRRCSACFNGLVPDLHRRPALAATCCSTAQSVLHLPPRDRAHVVGYVGQDPTAGFVTDTVEEELAYGMEQLGLDAATMRRRVEETLDLLGIADLRGRDLRTLSGGQQQRVAIGSVLTMHPRLLVLDEPTSALDPTAAEEVLATLTRLVHDLGVTVVIAEHRLERVVPFADRIVLVEGDGRVARRGARRDAAALAGRPADRRAGPVGRLVAAAAERARRPPARRRLTLAPGCRPPPAGAATGARRRWWPRGVTRRLRPAGRRARRRPRPSPRGQVTALMGRNGSGKSTLLWALQGVAQRGAAARSRVDGAGPGRARAPRRAAAGRAGAADRRRPALPRDRRRGVRRGRPRRRRRARARAAALLDRLAPGIDPARHPRDLSEGQRLALVLAVVLTSQPLGALPRRADARAGLPRQGGARRDPGRA